MTDTRTKAQREEIRELRRLLQQARDLIESADVSDDAWPMLAQSWLTDPTIRALEES